MPPGMPSGGTPAPDKIQVVRALGRHLGGIAGSLPTYPGRAITVFAAQRPKVRDRFRDLFKIGEGTYGIVYKANQTSDGAVR